MVGRFIPNFEEKPILREYKTEYYYLGVDIESNLIIIKPIGFWASVELVPDYKNQIFSSIDNDLKADFGVVYDISEMKAHPPGVRDEIHIKGIDEISKRKPKASAVVSPESKIAKMQVALIRKSTEDERESTAKEFATLDEAVGFIKGCISSNESTEMTGF